MTVTYTEDEWKDIAVRYLRELHSRTGWNVQSVIRPRRTWGVKSLVAIVPGWSLGTDVDPDTSPASLNDKNQEALEAAYKVSEEFTRKYRDIEFTWAGGCMGEKMAKMASAKRDILASRELLCIAKSLLVAKPKSISNASLAQILAADVHTSMFLVDGTSMEKEDAIKEKKSGAKVQIVFD